MQLAPTLSQPLTSRRGRMASRRSPGRVCLRVCLQCPRAGGQRAVRARVDAQFRSHRRERRALPQRLCTCTLVHAVPQLPAQRQVFLTDCPRCHPRRCAVGRGHPVVPAGTRKGGVLHRPHLQGLVPWAHCQRATGRSAHAVPGSRKQLWSLLALRHCQRPGPRARGRQAAAVRGNPPEFQRLPRRP